MKLVNVSFYDLKEIAKTKKIICFGAGKRLINFLAEYDNTNFINDIFLILDNNENKNGTFLEIKEKKIPILSVTEFMKSKRKNVFLVISCLGAYDIYEQLNKIDYFQDINGGVLNFIRSATNEIDNNRRFYPSDFRISNVEKIPKVIHYCWFGGGEIPKKNKEWMDTWKRYCPDYEIIEWNESNYDYKKNEYMYKAYKALKWGFVTDYARLDIIYNYGGIYLDTDVEIIKNLDDLLYQDAFAGVDATMNVSLGLGFGAIPEFQMIKELRDLYDEIDFILPEGKLNLTAIPTLQRPYFQKRGYLCNGEYQVLDGLTIYPEKVLSGKCDFTNRILPTEKTYAIHHYDGSWVEKEILNKRKKEKEILKKIISQ